MRGSVPLSAHDLVRRFYERLWNEWDNAAVDARWRPISPSEDPSEPPPPAAINGAPIGTKSSVVRQISTMKSSTLSAMGTVQQPDSGTRELTSGRCSASLQPAASSSTPALPSSPPQTISSPTSGYSATSIPSADN